MSSENSQVQLLQLIYFKRRIQLREINRIISVCNSQDIPTPLAINVAKKGIEAKPTSSILIINLNLETNLVVTLGNSPLLRGIAHKT